MRITAPATALGGVLYVVKTADVGERIAEKVTATAHQRHTSTFSGATALVTSV